MARYILQFESRALPGQDKVYDDWYVNIHIAEVLRVPGFKRLTARYRILNDEAQPRYLALYEIDSDDPQATLAALFASSNGMVLTPSLDATHVTVQILQSC